MFTEVLSPLPQELKSSHDKLSHLHPKSMFRLGKIGVLTSRCLYMKDDVPLCEPCMFGIAKRRIWITKGKKPGSIRKEIDNNPGASVSVEQLQSANTGLVPQFSGKLTSVLIWTSQVMVDHFSDITFVHLMRSTIQEETLTVKAAFERWDAIFGVKIHRYHAENGIFLNNLSDQQLRIPTRQKYFCQVEFHHRLT